jgi:hypothetical protein
MLEVTGMNRTVFLVALVVAAVVPAIAQQAMEAPAPSKEFETFMKTLEGTWHCETKRVAGAAGADSPETVVKSTIKISKDKDMNGMWYRGEHAIPKTKTAPEKKGVFMMGWDPAGKQVLVSTWNSAGNATLGFGSITGDLLVVSGEGHMMGKQTKYQETLSKGADGTIVQKFEADTGKGLQPMGENTCKK